MPGCEHASIRADRREQTIRKYGRLFRQAEEAATQIFYLFSFARPLIDAVLFRGIRSRQIR